jgi:hypothetical protein
LSFSASRFSRALAAVLDLRPEDLVKVRTARGDLESLDWLGIIAV